MEHKQSVASHYRDLLYKVAYRIGFAVLFATQIKAYITSDPFLVSILRAKFI